MAIEKPDYTVVIEKGDIEYRQYSSYLVAETWVESNTDYNVAANEGFRRLFNYITGDNQGQAKIDMTAPVQQSVGSEKIDMTAPVQRAAVGDGWLVNFMLPGKYTLDTAPIPDDKRIQVVKVPGKLMAVRKYSGRWTAKNYGKHSDKLTSELEQAGIEITGEVVSAVYDPPFMPPFMRRNEVMVPVASIPGS